MSINAHINEKTIKLYFDRNESSRLFEAEYSLGEGLIDFLRLSDDYIRGRFKEILNQFYRKEAYSDNIDEHMPVFNKLMDIAESMINEHVYLDFFTKNLIWFCIDYPFEQFDKAEQRDKLNKFIEKTLPHLDDVLNKGTYYLNNEIYSMDSLCTELYTLTDSDENSIEHYIHVYKLVLELAMFEIKAQKILIQENLSAALFNTEDEMTPLQRLLQIEYLREDPMYDESTFNTILVQYPEIDSFIEDKEVLRKTIIEKKTTFLLMHPIERLDDLIRLETFYMLSNNIMVKQCKYCGNYFIPQNRSDSDYCNRIKGGEKKPCNIVGPKRVYDLKKKNDPITKAHHKAYNRMRAKLRRESISQSEFCNWSDMATKKREECKAGKISFDKYQRWLDDDKKPQ